MSKIIPFNLFRDMLAPIKRMIDKKAETPNWEENDPASASHIHNRPFYESTAEKEIVSNLEIDFSSSPVTNPFLLSEIIEGQIYRVVWDGTEYNCNAYVSPEIGASCVGNGSLGDLTGGNGEPFFLTVYHGEVLLFAHDEETHTMSITTNETTTHKISEKFIPSAVPLIRDGEAGQLVSIRSVDDNGKPVEWEAVDAPVVDTSVDDPLYLNQAVIVGAAEHELYQYAKYGYVLGNGGSFKFHPLKYSNGVSLSLSDCFALYAARSSRDYTWLGMFSNPTQTGEAVSPFLRFHSNNVSVPSSSIEHYPGMVTDHQGFYLGVKYGTSAQRSILYRVDESGDLVLSFKSYEDSSGIIDNVREIVMASSTEGSTKRFKVTVSDDGTLSATEIT